jgi:lipopolysaccharide/colanic/teichoic acid biosynthesis glycosyltransferase
MTLPEQETPKTILKTFYVSRPRLPIILALLATPFLGWAVWDSLRLATGLVQWLPRSFGFAVGVFLLTTLFSLACSAWMESLPLRSKWYYRLAFFTAAGLIVIRWLVFSPAFFSPVVAITSGVLGSFFGALIWTSVKFGIWEDNQPPTEELSFAVYQRHQEIIGKPSRVSFGKRLFDILLSAFGLLISAPIWLLGIFLIWFEDPGPIFFVKNSVGLGGKNFHQFKFRTMVRDAEEITGPVLATEEDARTLHVGRFLRKTALDELPQLINILRGDMSFVGPRPQRTVLVSEYLGEMPEFAERHRVLPGLAGLAQVAGDYYITPRQKLRYDRIYTDYASLGFDLKLILLAFLLVFYLRWKPGWDGRIPRQWLHECGKKVDR